jgi:hypothetical protein
MGRSAKPRANQCHSSLQRGSGKSSLIKAAFKVDMSVRICFYFVFPFIQPVCPENKPAQARAPDISFAFRPEDNHHLIVHECPGPEPGDSQGLRAIRDFISNRTDPNRPAPERLHAIW